ncbi:ELWxxDGT repeat protein [Archangium sp. Cb G35]|uniref:ELWxxDGT repeat protein n=1 Tax=Archangium sp. Cb G35 TaxID=1920190 RepID=UPI0009FA0770|nr:ELWxxDGT repeat protein [Archangium sp. Cb G35]
MKATRPIRALLVWTFAVLGGCSDTQWAEAVQELAPRTTRAELNLGTPGVRDINTRPARFPRLESGFAPLSSGVTLFAASDGLHGSELWRSDGTEAGTSLVRDVAPGLASSTPRFLTHSQGAVFFVARSEGWSDLTTDALWKSDGTAAGTVLVKRLPKAVESDKIATMTQAGGTVFFIYEQEGEQQLWKSNGTEAGTVLVQSLGIADDLKLLAVGNTLFFTARDATNKPELWKLDAGGAVRLTTFTLSRSYYAPERLTQVGGTLFLVAEKTLWKSDGTPAGTVAVSTQSSQISEMVAVNGTLFFSSGGALWKINGTTATQVRGFSGGLSGLTAHGTSLYFAATEAASGSELWKSDGTAAGTLLVKELVTGSAGSKPGELFSWNGGLYFTASVSTGTRSLWRSDGTAAGTVSLKSWSETESPWFEKPHFLTPVGSALFFALPEFPDDSVPQLTWRTTGTAKTTREMMGLWTGTRDSQARTQALAVVGDSVFFVATDETPGESLWKSDGTSAGTFLLRTFARLGSESPYRSRTGAVRVGQTLFFSADDGVHGLELWKSNGSAYGTALVSDINPGPDGSYIDELVELNGTLFFTAHDSVNGMSLWRSDGTEAGTVLIKSGGTSGNVAELAVMGGALYFEARDDVHAPGLWKSDGTVGGTSLVKIPLGGTYSYLAHLTAVNGTLFFGTGDGYGVVQLWKSDGTASGTVLVKDGLESVEVAYPVSHQGLFYFLAGDWPHGYELWRSDGTAAGTFLLKDIQPGPGHSGPHSLTPVGSKMVFAAYDETHGWELWRTDGTEVGTSLLVDLTPGPGNGVSATGGDLVSILGVADRGLALFPGVDTAGGAELWQTDGTAAGTFRRVDVVPGPDSSDPNSLARVGDRLFFMAGDKANGREPRFVPFPADLGSATGALVTQGSTCDALRQVTPSCTNNALAPDVSFSWTAPSTGTFVFTTNGSNYDTSLQVSAPASGALLGCNDDTGETLQSSVTVSVAAGQTLLISVDGYDTECGTFQLGILPSP